MLVHIPKEIEVILREIVDKVKGIVHLTRIVLYGSYANGTYSKDSDLDIAIFVKDDSCQIIDAYRDVQKVCMAYDVDIQPQVFYESEYRNPMGIVEEVVQYGIEITNFNLVR